MNMVIVGFMMLMPALVSFVFIVGIPVLIGAWLLPYLRDHIPGKQLAVQARTRAAQRLAGGERRRDFEGVGAGRTPVPA